jgi:CubicO group peptidase (beta-lactamase class C family)
VRIASMTKPVTAVAAVQLIEEGRLGLDDPVERYIPAAAGLRVATSESFGADGAIPTESLARSVTVRDLLSFRSGFGEEGDDSDLAKLWQENHISFDTGALEERVNRALLRLPLFEQPGERWRYGWSADILARVIEVAAGEPFDEVLAHRIFEPLGMSDSRFVPPPGERDGMVTVYTQDENGNLVRADPVLWDPEGWTPGGGGLMSTASDYMRFALMLWNRGIYDGVKILEPESVALMTQIHVSSGVLVEEEIEGLGWGLGLAVVADSAATPTTDRDGDFWWAGYYGTTFFVSPESGLVGVVISQNQPSEYSDRPYAVHLAQSFAFFGL